jgi:hypothetical protein
MLKLIGKGLVLLIAIWISALVITRHDNKGSVADQNALRVKAAEKFNNLDILFVGSSYVYSGVIPACFDSMNIKTFNLGVSASGAYYTDLVIENFLKTGSAKTICIGMAYNTFSDIASDLWHLYPIHRYFSKPVSNESIVLKYGAWSGYYKMFRNSFKKGIKNIFSGNTSIDSAAYAGVIAGKGCELSEDIVSAAILKKEQHLFEPYKKSDFVDAKAECFLETITKCREKGIQIIVFEPPTNELSHYFSSSYIEKYNSFKRSLKDKVTVIECDPSAFDRNCFRNTDHLNVFGAKKLTACLANYIRKGT